MANMKSLAKDTAIYGLSSIVGRFLEHSRIFIFGEDGPDQKIFIGSAEYMSRNTVRRVEVAAPIEDERIR